MENVLKTDIKRAFNRAHKTYDKSCAVQKNICQDLVKDLSKFATYPEIIVDFACGTGVSTQCIASHFSFHKLYAVDFANKLLQKAKMKEERAEYICADFDQLNFPWTTIDLAICNMGLQWSPNLKHTLCMMRMQLKYSGLLAFSIPLSGTFNELKTDCRNEFNEHENIVEWLEELGFNLCYFKKRIVIEKFDNAFAAIRSIKRVGANCSMKPKDLKLGLLSLQRLKEMFVNNNDTNLTYQIGFYIAKNAGL